MRIPNPRSWRDIHRNNSMIGEMSNRNFRIHLSFPILRIT